MFYDSVATQALVDRIGWAEPVPPTGITLDAENILSNSGRLFNSYHKLASVEMVSYCTTNEGSEAITNDTLNDLLIKRKEQAVLKVLQSVFDINERANFTYNHKNQRIDLSGTDYSQVIVDRANLFDNAIGYQAAYDVLETIATSSRSNILERCGMDAAQLKYEMQGVVFEGKTITTGLQQSLWGATKHIIAILFPDIQRKPAIRNATNRW